jgi:hypothetical protein
MGNGGLEKRRFEDVGWRTSQKAFFAAVYPDAFRHDYSEDAFTAVASEIIALAGSRRKSTKAFLDKAVGVGKVILRIDFRLE